MQTPQFTKKSKIAVFVNDQVEFFSIEPVIQEMYQHPQLYDIDIVMDYNINPQSTAASTIKHSKNFLTKRGYTIRSVEYASRKKYDLCLATYAYYYHRVTAKCWLRYDYASINAKPALAATSDILQLFHASLCPSTYSADISYVYGRSYVVENLRFLNFQKGNRPQTDKKVLLFAPTYNDELTSQEIINTITMLKKDYYIIIKSHHATEYRADGQNLKNALMEIADEYVDPDVSITDLLARVDICLVNNSSAWADAVYIGVPAAIYSKNLDQFKLGDIHTPQYQYVHEGYLPSFSSPKDACATIKKLFSPSVIKKQKELANILFPPESKTGVKGYLDIINYYLSPASSSYIAYHNFNTNYIFQIKSDVATIPALQKEIVVLKEGVKYLKNTLAPYQKGKLYQLSKKVYDFKDKISLSTTSKPSKK